MKKIIDNLYKHDQEILTIYDRWADSKRCVEALIQSQKDLNEKLEVARAKKVSMEMELKSIELDLGTHEAEIAKCEKQKLSVTSEKSLNLVEDKIAKVGEKKDECEMNWLEKSEELSPHLKVIEALEGEEKAKSAEKEEKIPALNTTLTELQKELKGLVESRIDMMDGLSEPLVEKYESLRVKNMFQPVIFHLIDSGCPKCGMHIRNVDFEMIRYHDEVVPCESCGTIIYWE
ncbi:MAG: hypothetical protein KC646_16545 [Candidatus Cloacimonetes bacterium]|nr:hypothetical protein [Candidatus Cloacimonadota bacterium]